MKNIKPKKIIDSQNKLLKLKLLKTKIYKKQHQLENIKIEDIEYRLKKALHVIYKYHIKNKKILFIGNPLHLNKKIKRLVKNTKHILIPTSFWINGIITNQNSWFKHLLKDQKIRYKKAKKLLFQLEKKSDLIVIFDKSLNINALNESYNSRILIISLNSSLKILDNKSEYKIPGNFRFAKKKLRDNFFYSILNATLKKGNRVKFINSKWHWHLNSKKKNKQLFSN